MKLYTESVSTMHECTTPPLFALLLLFAVMSAVSGCSTASRTVKYSKSEIELIPSPLLPRVLKAPAEDVTVEVTASQLHGYATVTSITLPDSVVVSEDGHETTLSFDKITTIKQTQYLNGTGMDDKNTGAASTGEAIGTTLIYAPLIPIAAVTWPFMRMAGLDMNKNFSDEAKAMAIFGGLSRQAVIEYLGPPQAQHQCTAISGRDSLAFEVWSYPKERVIRGARALFFDSKEGKVYSTSVRFPTWANCTPLDESLGGK